MDVIEISVFMCLVAAIAGAGFLVSHYECHAKAEKQGYVCEWSPLAGCMVKTEHGWMDYDRLRYMKE